MTTESDKLAKLLIDNIEEIVETTVTDENPINAISLGITEYLDTRTFGISGDYSTLGYVNTISQEASGNAYYYSTTYTNEATANLRDYVDVQDEETLSSANSYTDSEISDLKDYVDQQDQIILEDSKSYTNIVSGNLQNQINQKTDYFYVDSQTSLASSFAYEQSITYTNNASSNLIEYIDNIIISQDELKEVLANGNDADNYQIKNLGDPTDLKDATNKKYIDTISQEISGQSTSYTDQACANLINYINEQDLIFLNQSKSYTNEASSNLINYIDEQLQNIPTETPSLSAVLNVGNDANNQRIINLADPENPQDVATKNYVDTISKEASGNAYEQSVTYTNNASSNLIEYIDQNIINLEDGIDATYLRLDCTNDPLSGTLQTSNILQINGETEYLKQESW